MLMSYRYAVQNYDQWLQKLDGDGLAFLHACGTIHERELAAGETLRVDTGCLVAFEPRVNYDIQMVKGVKTFLFGGERLFFASVTGPARSGCSRCRSPASPPGSSRPRASAPAGARRDRCSDRWGICWMETGSQLSPRQGDS